MSKISPSNTVLFFGAGSSIPSRAPSVDKIISILSRKYGIDPDGFSLSEIASIAEIKSSRKDLIRTLRKLFDDLSATGALINLPLYDWKNIYTTNYDDLIEQAFEKKDIPLSVFTSNFDFQVQQHPESIKLYKLHGSIDKDVSDGVQSRIVITEGDYDHAAEYRDALFDALKLDLNGASLVIIGYSLSDSHIKEVVNRAIEINSRSFSPASVFLVLYEKDENRAALYERRGITVAFGGLDEFFLELQKKCAAKVLVYSATGDPLDATPILRPITLDVAHEVEKGEKNASAMFHGWPASYADIKANLTFERSARRDIEKLLLDSDKVCSVIVGASGTGKSTLARQIVSFLFSNGFRCWEHKIDHTLLADQWLLVARELSKNSQKGVLFIDDAHVHLSELNKLVDLLVSENIVSLKLLLASPRNQWNPRIKTPNIFKNGELFHLGRLDVYELEKLLTLVDSSPDLQPLVESSFSGFSRSERKRRLEVKCESETFVCLKNIFASEKFDDIVLREFAELDEGLREIYRLVAAMESSGIKVHRQMIIRLLGIPAGNIQGSLSQLTDIIHEYSISEREGIYGWKGRHPVIMDIITKYKMTEYTEFYDLFERVVDNLVPTYDIEVRTIKQLCAFDSGISRIPDKHLRNKLLRKMISKAPGERIPRHRLVRYLIDINELEKAETEIRLYEHDFRSDGPIQRFKIILMLARAERTPGILDEDRKAILEMAREQSVNSVDRYPDNKDILRTYCDVGIEYFKRTGEMFVFDDAMDKMRTAEGRIGDPDITNIIARYERRISGIEHYDSYEESS
tara:strand:- start:1781 stop:4186 length:2406 start_codon:yes stop_codon:yes gene_type:complete